MLVDKKHFEEIAGIPFLKDKGTCPKCHSKGSLRTLVNEFGVHGTFCLKCGWEKKVKG